jgi:hypothetical protein
MTSTRANLKAVFKTGSIPKEQDFADLIDASVNQADDGFLIVEKDGKKNVGVGVEVPQAKLHVGGDLMVDSGLTVEGVANIPNMLKIGGPTEPTLSKLQVQGGATIDSLIISAENPDRDFKNLQVKGLAIIDLLIISSEDPSCKSLQVKGGAIIDSLTISADGKEWMSLDSNAQRLYVNSDYDNEGKPCTLRVGSAWGMPGLYSGDYSSQTRSTNLVLGAPKKSKIYFGENTNDAWIESGTGNAYIKGMVGIGKNPDAASKSLQVKGGAIIDSLIISADGKKEWMILDSSAQRLYVNSEYDSNGKPCKLRVGAAWGMPGLYSGDYSGETSSTDLVLGAPPQSKIYFGEAKNDAWIESGSGNAYIRGEAFIESLKVNSINLGDKWLLTATKDGYASDEWLRLIKPQNNKELSGGFAANKLWTRNLIQESDLRSKINSSIQTYSGALESLMQIGVVEFKYKTHPLRLLPHIGFIAQQVEEIFPEAIEIGLDGMKGIQLGCMTALLAQAVKDLAQEVNELKLQIQELQKQNSFNE